MGYQDVKDKLYNGHRKIANNTHLEQLVGHITMKLHSNTVARFYDSHLELFSAGYHTQTTKSRLNLALKLAGIYGRISQLKFEWYLDTNIIATKPFEEGIKISYTGWLVK